MIYISQYVFIYEDKEETFLEFENKVLPILSNYHGVLHSRIRPDKKSVISINGEIPYEIHLVSFPNEECLKAYSEDRERTKYLHLKRESVKRELILKDTLVE